MKHGVTVFKRIAMQNTSTHIVFKNKAEAMHYTDQKDSQYKYSIIDKINYFTRPSSFYEFQLYYPTIPAFLHWKQKVSPLDYTEISIANDAQNIGFVSLDSRFKNFKGLMMSLNSRTLFDGDNTYIDNWQYSVGIIDNYLNYLIPGPYFNGNTESSIINIDSYELYMRVVEINFTCKHFPDINFNVCFIFIFLFI